MGDVWLMGCKCNRAGKCLSQTHTSLHWRDKGRCELGRYIAYDRITDSASDGVRTFLTPWKGLNCMKIRPEENYIYTIIEYIFTCSSYVAVNATADISKVASGYFNQKYSEA